MKPRPPTMRQNQPHSFRRQFDRRHRKSIPTHRTVHPELATLQENFPIQLDPSMTADAWVNAAFENNLSIKAAEFGLKSLEKQYQAKTEPNTCRHFLSTPVIPTPNTVVLLTEKPRRQHHLPDLKFTPYIPAAPLRRTLDKPLYLQEQAKHQLASTQRLVRVEARTEYINIKTNIQTVESLQQNIVSRESALEATREGYKCRYP